MESVPLGHAPSVSTVHSVRIALTVRVMVDIGIVSEHCEWWPSGERIGVNGKMCMDGMSDDARHDDG